MVDKINGVNGALPLSGNGKSTVRKQEEQQTFNYGTSAVGDVASFSTKPAFSSYDMEQMWQMAGITKPESIKPLEQTVAFASEGAEYGVEYSEDDLNLARFMFDNLKP